MAKFSAAASNAFSMLKGGIEKGVEDRTSGNEGHRHRHRSGHNRSTGYNSKVYLDQSNTI
jgi:hypothetical protein